MQKFFKSFGWAMNGIQTVWNEEMNFRIELLAGFGAFLIGLYVHFTKLEWVIISGCICAVLASEILNTSIEDLCNKVQPNEDPAIGKIKDMMGGFVLLVSITSLVIGVIVISNHII